MTLRGRTEAPEKLPLRDWKALHGWCHEHFPWWERDLDRLIGRCLDHHGARGTRMANWRRACQSWVRKQDELEPQKRQAWRKRQREAREAQELRDLPRRPQAKAQVVRLADRLASTFGATPAGRRRDPEDGR